MKQSIYQDHMRTHHDDFRAPAVIAHFLLVMLPAGMVSIFTVLGTAIVWPPVLVVRGVLRLVGRRRNRPQFRDVVVWEQRCIIAVLERTLARPLRTDCPWPSRPTPGSGNGFSIDLDSI